jgi:hypothetical protein
MRAEVRQSRALQARADPTKGSEKFMDDTPNSQSRDRREPPKVYWRFQDLHTASPKADWVSIQQVEKDVCLLYHQLSEYSYIVGDLYWGSVYGLPYWEFLDLQDLKEVEKEGYEFVRDGCLVMILAMAWGIIDDTSGYLSRWRDDCERSVSQLTANDADTEKLIRTVSLALDVSGRRMLPPHEIDELRELSNWVHHRYVLAYFKHKVHEFETNPYFGPHR